MTLTGEATETAVLAFPDGFAWGAATAAYQIEGAVAEDGRKPSIWDTFAHTPGRVAGDDNGDVAADHYHRVDEDVELMRAIGLRAYRFSIAWPRVQPDGRGAPNPKGLDFYRRLVDALLEAEIEPYPTLYHWDLPQAFQDAGGWANRDTAHRFVEYVLHVHDALGDRVPRWMTLNEPWCSAFLGYGLGIHAPGIKDARQAVAAAHHLLLAHGLAVGALRAAAAPQTRLGIVLNLEPYRPASESEEDVAAARLGDGIQNRFFLDAIFRGAYPADVLRELETHVELDFVRAGDAETIAAPIDILGVNYYRPAIVRARREPAPGAIGAWPGGETVEFVPFEGATTAMGWGVDAGSLDELLLRVRAEYGDIPLFVTENGAAFDDVPDDAGRVRDLERLAYIERHLRAVHRAIAAGVDVRGYFVWSLMDNLEWAEGYRHRFGLVYVDFDTQRRIAKESARWYRRVILANGIPV